MNEQLLNRAEILIQQSRYSEAEKILADLLSTDPTNTHILTMSSEVAMERGDAVKAIDLINQAIGFEPNLDVLYFVKARILYRDGKNKSAEKNLEEAIQLNPSSASYFGLLASIKLSRKEFQEALDISDHALELDSENLLALNNRSTALLKLNRKDESYETIEDALHEDPNNTYTHANYGWSLLEKGDHVKALDHFKLSLQSDPSNAYAQGGMIEALKGKYWFYRMFLKYSFFMSNIASKYQWFIIIGFYVLFRMLRTLADKNPEVSVFITPILILMAILAFSTWVINPIGNLLLRLNKYGQFLLDKESKMSSNLVGVSVLVCIMGLLAYALTSNNLWLPVAAFGFAMMVPFSVMFAPAKYKNALVIYAIAMVGIGTFSIFITFSTGILFNLFSTIFIIGFVAFQWGANFIMISSNSEE
jgi:tetratricopeptide (TPR) repeat protein